MQCWTFLHKHKPPGLLTRQVLWGLFISLASITIIHTPPALAQNLGIAEYIVIEDGASIPTGSIVIHAQGKYALSSEPYSKDLFGVITRNPALALIPEQSSTQVLEDEVPLVKTGSVRVRVNGTGGTIQNGDSITSSEIPGVGMRAQKSGFVLGIAQADFAPTSPQEETLIPIMLDTKFTFADDAPTSSQVVQRLMSVVSLNTVSVIEDPVTTFRYTAAAFAVLISLGASGFTFGRVAFTGIEALGRNPLAKNSILTGIIINTLLALAVAGTGPAVAYFILQW